MGSAYNKKQTDLRVHAAKEFLKRGRSIGTVAKLFSLTRAELTRKGVLYCQSHITDPATGIKRRLPRPIYRSRIRECPKHVQRDARGRVIFELPFPKMFKQ